MADPKIKAPQAGTRGDFRKLGLDIRVVNALAAQGVVALEDLAHITEREFASFRGIGPNTHKQLKDYLKKENAPAEPGGHIHVALPPEFLRAVDDWCLAQTERIVSRADAIRLLAEMTLARETS